MPTTPTRAAREASASRRSWRGCSNGGESCAGMPELVPDTSRVRAFLRQRCASELVDRLELTYMKAKPGRGGEFLYEARRGQEALRISARQLSPATLHGSSPASRAMRVVSGASPWTNSAPCSSGAPTRGWRTVNTRPPMRSRASSTITRRPASRSSRAAAIPAAPAPTTITSAASAMRHRSGDQPVRASARRASRGACVLGQGVCPARLRLPRAGRS